MMMKANDPNLGLAGMKEVEGLIDSANELVANINSPDRADKPDESIYQP